MKPYFHDAKANITIYHGNCVEILPQLTGGGSMKFDLVLTDPPYGIGYVHGDGGGNLARSTTFNRVKVHGDDQPFDPAQWLSFETVILWGGNHFASRLPDSSCWLVWDKREGICSNDQADCELAWTNIKQPARLKRLLWNGMLKKTGSIYLTKGDALAGL
jgi:site-specific DNA-methyltransferase (adenine-specific)